MEYIHQRTLKIMAGSDGRIVAVFKCSLDLKKKKIAPREWVSPHPTILMNFRIKENVAFNEFRTHMAYEPSLAEHKEDKRNKNTSLPHDAICYSYAASPLITKIIATKQAGRPGEHSSIATLQLRNATTSLYIYRHLRILWLAVDISFTFVMDSLGKHSYNSLSVAQIEHVDRAVAKVESSAFFH